jgi:tetratricopeptide (TPR) repeat protein
LRPFQDDKNVSPHEMAAYAAGQGYFAEVRAGGSTDLARQFLNQGIPLLIETWLEEEPNNGMGHYRLLVGYDDAAQQWTAYDSYVQSPAVSPDPATYRGIYLPYAETDFLWNVFNHTYVLIYPPDRASAVAAILGETQTPAVMWQQAFNRAQNAVLQTPGDPFAYFNLGTSMVELGDYAGAAAAFDQARAIGLPWRMFWYQFGIFRAYAETGRYADMISLADATLAVTDSLEELHYWRGRGLEGLGDLAGARAAYHRALNLNPNFSLASTALAALPG